MTNDLPSRVRNREPTNPSMSVEESLATGLQIQPPSTPLADLRSDKTAAIPGETEFSSPIIGAEGLAFGQRIARQAARKLKARGRANQTIWFGFGMSGLIGWSVAVPAVLGALLGLWLDGRYPGAHSYTLALLAVGLAFGCWNAWHWVDMENKAIGDEDKPHE